MPRVSTRWTQDHNKPRPPLEVAEAVEMWARSHGRHATMEYVPPLRCWSVNLTLKPGDPALRRYQEGKAEEEPKEGVLLIEWDAASGAPNPVTGAPAGAYRAVDLEEYGASGVVELLEKGNTWSGRGEFESLQEAVTAAASRNREQREKIKARQKEWARQFAGDVRRQYQGIPFLRVGIDLRAEVKSDAGD